MRFKHCLVIVMGYGALLGACAAAPPGQIDPSVADEATAEQQLAPLPRVARPPMTAPVPAQHAWTVEPALRKVPNHDTDITAVTAHTMARSAAAGSTSSPAVEGSATT